MSLSNVINYLKQYGLESKVQQFDVSSATVELAAKALNCAPQRIAKTLAFKVNNCPVLIVAAGDVNIDNSKFKQQFSTKAIMLNPNEVQSLIGHAIGGVCPFAVNSGVSVYLDESLKRFETVFPACGTSNSAIELSIAELEKASNHLAWVNVTKIKQV